MEIDTAEIDTAEIDTAEIDTAEIDTAEIDTAEIDTAGRDTSGSAELAAEPPKTGEPPRSRLKIVLVEFLPSGGMFQFSFLFGQALARQGHEVLLLTGPDPELRSTTPGFEVVEIFPTWHPAAGEGGSRLRRKVRRLSRALLLAESWRRATRFLRLLRPDIAQFGEFRYPLDSGMFALLARRCPGTALVDVAHNPLPYDVNSKTESVEKGGRLTRSLLAAAYRACDLVLVLGEGPRSNLLSAFPGLHRVAVVGHGDYSALASDGVPPPSAAPAHALFFGAWTKYKNLPLLLDSFELVRRQLPDARLTIAGPVMPDVDLPAITQRAAGIGNVDLRPGYVPITDLPDLFAAHRVVVFTYETVNISGSVHMAYTFGRPVVATDVGSMSDAVPDRVTGLLAPPDPLAVANALVEVLADPELADRLGAHAGRRVQEAASWTAVAERAVDAYRGVVPLTAAAGPA